MTTIVNMVLGYFIITYIIGIPMIIIDAVNFAKGNGILKALRGLKWWNVVLFPITMWSIIWEEL